MPPACVQVATPGGPRWVEVLASAVHGADGSVIGIRGISRDVTERRTMEESLRASLEQLRLSEEKLRLLAQRQAAIREEERKRLGFDLHDDVCQELVGTGILIESVRQRVLGISPGAAADLQRVECHLGDAVEHLRLLARELRPLLLHELGLEGSLRSLAAGMASADTSVAARFPTAVPRLDEASEIAVYRIAQEALGNASRHAGARSVVLTLAASDGILRLEVRDDGRGFDPREGRLRGLGLLGMEERALALGGRLDVRSEPGQGTAVRLECPIAAHVPASAA